MKKTLGKGLGALIPGIQSTEDKYQEILISEIFPNPFQPREEFIEELIQELAESIKENGVIQPVIVRKIAKGYELISGERRWRASIIAEKERIPAVILDVDDEASVKYAIIENIQREDLNAVEIAKAFKLLHETYGFTQKEIADSVGKNRSTVANYMRILSLPEKILNHVSRGTLTAGHIRCLITLATEEQKLKIAQKVIEFQWSVRKTEDEVKKLLSEKSKKQMRRDDQILFYEKELQTAISRPIRCSRKGKGIEIRIKMTSEKDVSEFLSKLQSKL